MAMMEPLPAETRKQIIERRLRALEIHIQDLEERLHLHYLSPHGVPDRRLELMHDD